MDRKAVVGELLRIAELLVSKKKDESHAESLRFTECEKCGKRINDVTYEECEGLCDNCYRKKRKK